MDYTVNSTLDRHGEAIAAITDMPFTALGGQPAFTPDDLDAFLRERRIAAFSYIRKDGRPNQAPLWYTYRDGAIHFVVATDSAKHRALRRDARVCVAIQDERPPYRAAIIDGTVELTDIGGDGGLSRQMAVRYFGKLGAAEYEKLSKDDREANGQTLLRLIPSEVKGFDNTKVISRALLGYVRVRDNLPIPRRWL